MRKSSLLAGGKKKLNRTGVVSDLKKTEIYDKENAAEWIKLQVDNRVFFPGKVIMNRSSLNRSLKPQLLSPKNALKPQDVNVTPKSATKSPASKENQKKIQFSSPVFNKEHKKLVDSLQSYYESEQPNLQITGKCKQNYINFKLNYAKSKKTKKNRLKREIRSLKKQNCCLKEQIRSLSNKKCKSNKSLTPNARWASRNSPANTGRYKQCDSSQTYRKPCVECTDLLACGLSSGHCIEHKWKTNINYL